ncbi:hypothetical protein U0C82_03760 [Fulvimarina sp. 2208YS6-2-32]|uniref:DUF2190 domain-containing protein n=1 Tax=Fulvimarina uroteuthidis TaxID=3098149 RepID=A0ABU5HZQ8_9HYPH|nr:hypothetical protein [Fulvimarina sp. 2208YS6-2-32]MDY8108265.1 hypothetical protein [Fulvimarina sp. 2208YS6-2-32]
MALQTTYLDDMPVAYAGMVANTELADIISRTVEDAALPFGKAVTQGTGDKSVHPTTTGDASTLGVSVLSNATENSTVNGYPQGDTAAILIKGVIWVTADGAVAAGDDVTVTVATGAYGTKAAGAGVLAVPNARWETSAADGALAQLRLK